MKLQESGEMYLETVFILSETAKTVRSIDVAEALGYSKASVSRAVGILKNSGYLSTDGNGALTLTESGRAVAKKTYERHRTLTDFFVRIGVDEETAAMDACKIEHDISDVSFEKLKEYISRP